MLTSSQAVHAFADVLELHRLDNNQLPANDQFSFDSAGVADSCVSHCCHDLQELTMHNNLLRHRPIALTTGVLLVIHPSIAKSNQTKQLQLPEEEKITLVQAIRRILLISSRSSGGRSRNADWICSSAQNWKS